MEFIHFFKRLVSCLLLFKRVVLGSSFATLVTYLPHLKYSQPPITPRNTIRIEVKTAGQFIPKIKVSAMINPIPAMAIIVTKVRSLELILISSLDIQNTPFNDLMTEIRRYQSSPPTYNMITSHYYKSIFLPPGFPYGKYILLENPERDKSALLRNIRGRPTPESKYCRGPRYFSQPSI